MSKLSDFELTNLIFVFGTLKKDYGNGKRLLGKAEFLGEAISTEGNYIMQDVGFPTLWQTKSQAISLKGRVAGEIYQVSLEQLEACDRLENNGRMYTRTIRSFQLPDKSLAAWVYLWNLDRNNEPIEPVDGVLVWDREGRRKMRRVE
jgi:gamma-glutamylcyclotransferase (GGCT)/AIG2-like uncharacterized protein YtfP